MNVPIKGSKCMFNPVIVPHVFWCAKCERPIVGDEARVTYDHNMTRFAFCDACSDKLKEDGRKMREENNGQEG